MKTKTRGKKTKKRQPIKTITLTMDRRLKDILETVARDASTDIPTVSQVLLVTAMHMGRNAGATGLAEAMEHAGAKIAQLQATLQRCRTVMEVNDPGNARDIFGEPAAPKTEETAPVT